MSFIRQCLAIGIRLLPVGELILVGLSGLLPGSSHAATLVTSGPPCILAWDPCPSQEVAGYAVYCRFAGAAVTRRIDAGPFPTATIYDLRVGSNYVLYVVAYNRNGFESGPSPPISYRPSAMSPLRLTVESNAILKLEFRAAPDAICRVEWTPSLSNPQWRTLGTATADASGKVTVADSLAKRFPARFYRAVR